MAVVDKVVDKHGTRAVAEAYLQVPVHGRGPGDRRQALLPAARSGGGRREVRRRSSRRSTLFTIDEVFGGWQKAQKTHFADGGVFDQIYQPGAEGSSRGGHDHAPIDACAAAQRPARASA